MARKTAKKERKPRCKADQWLTENGLLLIGAWARDEETTTDEKIAKKMGIARSTLSEWKKRYPKIASALSENKEIVDIKVENRMLKNALDGDFQAEKYWIENRKPSIWKSKREEEKKKDDKIEIVFVGRKELAE